MVLLSFELCLILNVVSPHREIAACLLCHLTGCSNARLQNDAQLLGPVFEAYVLQELGQQASWSQTRPSLYYYRSLDGQEIDLILENRAGVNVGIEVKATTSVAADHFKALRGLDNILGKKFMHGIVIYLGERVIPFGEKLTALPVSSFWS